MHIFLNSFSQNFYYLFKAIFELISMNFLTDKMLVDNFVLDIRKY